MAIVGGRTKTIIIGVDLGLVNLFVAVALGLGMKGVRFCAGGWARHKWQSFDRKRRACLDCGDTTTLGSLDGDLERFNTDLCRKAARELVEFAKGLAAEGALPVLVLEDLRFEDIRRAGGSSDGALLAKREQAELACWPYARMLKAIIDVAAWDGIPVVIVPPKGTSLECPRCGSTDAIRKREVHRLVCPDCGYRANDDYCAARLIGERFKGYLDARTTINERSLKSAPMDIGTETSLTSYKEDAPCGANDPEGGGEVGTP
jgi:IS605 OrfB family transposase